MFEFGEDLLNRVEVRRIGREEEKMRACGPDGAADGGGLVAAEVVENDDVARAQCRGQNVGDIGPEDASVDPSPWSLGPVAFLWLDVDQPRGIDSVVAQGGNDGRGVSSGRTGHSPSAAHHAGRSRARGSCSSWPGFHQ